MMLSYYSLNLFIASSILVLAGGILGISAFASVAEEVMAEQELVVSMTNLSDRFADMEAEVISVVNDAVVLYQEYGQDALGMITAGADDYEKDTAYTFVLDLDTQEVVAHGAIKEHVGQTSVSLTESDKPFEQIKAELESDGNSWVTYTFVNPETGQNQIKVSFVALYDGYVFGSGFYLTDLEAGMITSLRTANSAAALYETHGQAAFEMINEHSTSYEEGDTYAFVVDTNTENLVAHGVDPGRVGDRSVSLTASSKPFEQIQQEFTANNGTWVSYTFLNPDSGDEELKLSWLTIRDNYVFGSGFYPSSHASKEAKAILSTDVALYMYAMGGDDAFSEITALNIEDETYPFVLDYKTAEEIADGSVLDRRGQIVWEQHELKAAIGDVLDILESGQGAWITYVFLNPGTGENQAKKSWVIMHDDYLFGSGFYLEDESAQIVEVEWNIDTTIELYKELGARDSFARVNAMQSTMETYPFVFDSDLVVVAHGANTALIGQALSDLVVSDKDDDQIKYELGGDDASSWITYTFENPATSSTEQKISLLVLYDGYVFGSGYYSGTVITACR